MHTHAQMILSIGAPQQVFANLDNFREKLYHKNCSTDMALWC